MEDVLLAIYHSCLQEEYKTCRAICRRYRDELSTFLLTVPLKEAELNTVFVGIDRVRLVGFYTTAGLVTLSTPEEEIVERARKAEKHVRAFGVSYMVPDSDCSIGFRIDSLLGVSTSDRVTNIPCIETCVSNLDTKIRKQTAVVSVCVSNRKLSIHNDASHSRQMFSRLSQLCNQIVQPISHDLDLKSKHRILLERCARFDIDPKFVSRVLVKKVQTAIETLSNEALMCYTLMNAICLEVEHNALKPLRVDSEGFWVPFADPDPSELPERDEVVRILLSCL